MEAALWSLLVTVPLYIAGLLIWHNNFRRRFMKMADAQAERLGYLATALPLDHQTGLQLRNSEEYVYHLDNVLLVEPRRAARVTTRSTDAITVALAKGVYYTAAGGKSVSPEPQEEMRIVDHGVATFTTERVVFVGAKQSREWDFRKLLSWYPAAGGRLMMAVSNRQKVSGIQGLNRSDLLPDVVMQIVEHVRDGGWEAGRESAQWGAENARAQSEFVRWNFWAGEHKISEYVEQLDKKEAAELAALSPKKQLVEGSPERTAPSSPQTPRATVQELEVVGEFFYKDSFAALRELFGTEGGTEHIVEVELRNDPHNPYSDSGMAVAVFIRDLQVGHIPERFAPDVFEQLEPKGGRLTVGARLWLDHQDSKPNKSSVTILLDSRLSL